LGADKIAKAFNDAADDDEVKPSCSASTARRHAGSVRDHPPPLVHAQKEGKPVIVSMGEVAASGGYWASMNADRIVAEPGTLTGRSAFLPGSSCLAV